MLLSRCDVAPITRRLLRFPATFPHKYGIWKENTPQKRMWKPKTNFFCLKFYVAFPIVLSGFPQFWGNKTNPRIRLVLFYMFNDKTLSLFWSRSIFPNFITFDKTPSTMASRCRSARARVSWLSCRTGILEIHSSSDCFLRLLIGVQYWHTV